MKRAFHHTVTASCQVRTLGNDKNCNTFHPFLPESIALYYLCNRLAQAYLVKLDFVLKKKIKMETAFGSVY